MRKEKIKIILIEYGEEGQAIQLVQECSELIVALTKEDKENIKEEIADVKIMIEQFKMFEKIQVDSTYEFFKGFYKATLDLCKELIVDTLECTLAELIYALKKERPLQSVLSAVITEVVIDKYIEFNGIDIKEIDKIIDFKIKRQLKRIEDRKRNRFLNNKIN